MRSTQVAVDYEEVVLAPDMHRSADRMHRASPELDRPCAVCGSSPVLGVGLGHIARRTIDPLDCIFDALPRKILAECILQRTRDRAGARGIEQRVTPGGNGEERKSGAYGESGSR